MCDCRCGCPCFKIRVFKRTAPLISYNPLQLSTAAQSCANCANRRTQCSNSNNSKRCVSGNWVTAGAHIITAVIGSGVLSLAWAISTMGWAAGPVILFLFALITWYMSLLLADAYRNPRVTGKRNYTYPGAVKEILGEFCFHACYLLCSCLNAVP